MLDHERALNYFQNLYLTAVADRKLTKEETSFLVEVAQQMGIKPREAAEVMMNCRDQGFIIPETEEEKIVQLEDIIIMMMVDNKIHEKEYQLCLHYAQAIGHNKQTLDRIILKVIKDE
ncbi:MAG: hypothetical protein HC880_14250 [Bacteroidia bacterium]|nr:hypothetical protein [Bacteroidia bacterium]